MGCSKKIYPASPKEEMKNIGSIMELDQTVIGKRIKQT